MVYKLIFILFMLISCSNQNFSNPSTKEFKKLIELKMDIDDACDFLVSFLNKNQINSTYFSYEQQKIRLVSTYRIKNFNNQLVKLQFILHTEKKGFTNVLIREDVLSSNEETKLVINTISNYPQLNSITIH